MVYVSAYNYNAYYYYTHDFPIEITEYYMFCNERCNAENSLIEVSHHTYIQYCIILCAIVSRNIEKLQMTQAGVDEFVRHFI